MHNPQAVMYYATANTEPVRQAVAAGLLGQMRQPDVGNRLVDGARWVADNGCFNARTFTVQRWGRWLLAQPRTADWATVPDVVADHAATLRRWRRYAAWVRRVGFTPAFVCQDGCGPDDIPADAGAVFLGGTTDYKLSDTARACVAEARRRGIPAQVWRWRQYGLDAYTADRLACRAGVHPAEIWPNWFAEAAA